MTTRRKGDRPQPDQVWHGRRETWRRLRIVEVTDDGTRVQVKRSTSRRTQSMSVDTLWKDYRRDELA